MKLDLPKIESYSQAFAEKVCADFYQGDRGTITGQDILKLTNSEQVNYFVLKNLFERWKEEASRLRSPYFDFEQDEVRDALSVFMNKLSKHIQVRKEFFKPLLVKAVADSLAYINHPHDFLKVEFCGKPIVSAQEVREKEKYFRHNKFLVQAFSKKIQLSGKAGVAQQEALTFLTEAFKNYEMSLEPVQKQLEAFQKILKLPFAETSIESEDLIEKKVPVSLEPSKENFPSMDKKNTNPLLEPFKEENSHETLNDLFAKGKQLTLNEILVQKEQETLLTKSRKSKIHELRASIPINLRYIFINELFKGSQDDYLLAVSQIDRSESYESALNIIAQVYAKKYDWDPEKSEVREFYELVERRFY
ncbi:MAG: hypothetical protein MUF42_05630 [Cytophagaceae bacterium]|jgi:hypothetical protein|nr:hypothetical protein [Cytophagaceae bacterium]